MNKIVRVLLLVLFATTNSALCAQEETNNQSKEIQAFKISPKAATQLTGVLCTVIAAFNLFSNPLISLPVLVGGVYTVANPEKVMDTVEKTVETVQSEEQLESTTRKIAQKIKRFLKNLFAD